MSIKLMTLAWTLRLDPAEKLVLLKLADWVNEERERAICWPSIAKLADLTNVSETTVKRAIRSLEAAGHITRQLVPGETTRYHVHPGQNDRGVKLTGVTGDLGGGSPTTPNTEEIQKPSVAKATSGSRAKPKLTFEQSFPNETVIHAFRVTCVGWAAKELSWSPGNAGAEYDRFVTNAQAHDRRYANWEKAWQNWCRSDYCKTKPGKGGDSLLNPGGVTMKDLIGG